MATKPVKHRCVISRKAQFADMEIIGMGTVAKPDTENRAEMSDVLALVRGGLDRLSEYSKISSTKRMTAACQLSHCVTFIFTEWCSLLNISRCSFNEAELFSRFLRCIPIVIGSSITWCSVRHRIS